MVDKLDKFQLYKKNTRSMQPGHERVHSAIKELAVFFDDNKTGMILFISP